MPKVSVLVPVFNMERYVRDCFESIRAQTLDDLEILAIDDGSTDGSLGILRELASQDDRIRVVEKRNTGYGDSMNLGLEMARGEYVGIVEPDDFIDADMYATLVEHADRHRCDIVKSNYYEHDGQGDRAVDFYSELDVPFGEPFDPKFFPRVLLVRPSIWAGIYRRSMLQDAGIDFAPTPGASYQDASFNHMCWIAAARAVVLKEPFAHYRMDNETSSSKSDAKVFSVCDEFERSLAFLKNRGTEALGVFGPVLGAMRVSTCKWNYNRISSDHHEDFATRWAGEMGALLHEGLVDLDLLHDRTQDDLFLLVGDSHAFCARYPNEVPWQGFRLDAPREAVGGGARTLRVLSEAPRDPAVSVIVPLYKVERYVRETVQSLLAQTFMDFEVICVDDGSPDASAAIARGAACGDARFRFLAQGNRGQSAARNRGVDESSGTYLLFLDADDLYVPEAIGRLYAKAADDELDYLDFTARTFYESEQLRQTNNEDIFEQRSDIPGIMTGPELFVEYQRRGQYICSECFHFFTRDLLRRSGLRFREDMPKHEDELFSPLLIAHAERAAFLNEPLHHRRLRADSIMTEKRGLVNVACMLEAARKLEAWLRANAATRESAFVTAMIKRIAVLRDIAVDDATKTPTWQLELYAASLQIDDRIDFELVIEQGVAVRNRMHIELDSPARVPDVAGAATGVARKAYRALKSALPRNLV